ncbi:hypothetical protein LJR009_003394 [Bosea sp. LjRoot9]|uniref:hypothetical protein n=1 Tax=Bosea sp. LjRoot9 TaxID=3342341 RepID=UPI003ECC843F
MTRRKLLAQIPAAIEPSPMTSHNLAGDILFVNPIVLLKKRNRRKEFSRKQRRGEKSFAEAP